MAKFSRLMHVLAGEAHDLEEIADASPDDYLNKIGIVDRQFNSKTICSVKHSSGETVFLKRQEWSAKLKEDDCCVFTTYPQRDPLKSTRDAIGLKKRPSIGIAIAEHFLGPLFPDFSYNGSEKPEEVRREESQPTYELTDQRNSNRLGQPIPVQYGRIRSYMDVASKSYTEYISDEQFLFVLLCVGQGQFDVEDLQIDDTDINSFDDVTFNILDPGTPPSLVEVVESSPDIAAIELLSTFKGPFTATAVGFTANRIDFDISFPSGLQNAGGNEQVTVNMELRKIDINGDPIGGFFEIDGSPFEFDEATNAPINKTFTHNLAVADQGRYEARVKRIGDTSTSTSISDKAVWSGLRAYSADGHPDYKERTMIEIKIKATEQLNSSNFGIFNVVSTRKINVWNGATFDFETSVSPVWAFYDLVTNQVYGARLDATSIDIDELFALSEHLEDTDFFNTTPECNLRFENGISAIDALAQIGATCRCQVYQKSGKVWLVRDEEKAAITAFFTPMNIVEDSLSVSWELSSVTSANHVRLTYFDEVTSQQEEVAGVQTGVIPNIPEEVNLKGVTNRQLAWQEAMFLDAQNTFRNKIIEFETDIEGYLPDFLDQISVTHESLVEFTSGVVQEIVEPEIFLSEPPDFKGSEFGYISFKDKDGKQIGPFTCVPGDNSYKVIVPCFDEIENPLELQIDQPDVEPTAFSFGPGSFGDSSQICVVLSVASAGAGRVKIRCVNHDPRVHTADVGVAPPIGRLFELTL